MRNATTEISLKDIKDSKFKAFLRNEFTPQEIIEIGTYGCKLGIEGLNTNEDILYQYETYKDDLWKIVNKMAKSLDVNFYEVIGYEERRNQKKEMCHETFCKMMVWTCSEIIAREILSEDKDLD